jgi:hypothetical protein
MKTSAIGVRVHSGWGALVAVSGAGPSAEILARARITIIDPKMPGAFQPYHFGMNLSLPKAEAHIAKCAALSKTLAVAALRPILDDLQSRDYRVEGCAILQGSGRALPPLPQILAAHPRIHTAEGVFFRQIFTSPDSVNATSPNNPPPSSAKKLPPSAKKSPPSANNSARPGPPTRNPPPSPPSSFSPLNVDLG